MISVKQERYGRSRSMRNCPMGLIFPFSLRFLSVATLGVFIAATGCEDRNTSQSSAPKTSSPETRKIADKTSPPESITGKPEENIETFLGRIAAAQSLLEWYEVRQTSSPALSTNPRVITALSEKETELRDRADIKEMNDCVDLMAFRWEKVKPLNPKIAQFKVTVLLYIKSKPDLKAGGRDVWFSLRGTVESSKAVLLPTPKERERGYIEFAIKGLKPEEWPEGDYVALSRTVEYPNLSYYFSGVITRNKEEKWEEWTDRVNLGWYTDLD
jgi:hypothetical protein